MDALALLFLSVSHTFNLPPGLLSAVCFVESSHNVSAMHLNDGDSHSIGVCQIKLSTSRFLGFKGTAKALSNPKTNVFFAGKYLHYQLCRYNGNLYKAVAAYNVGTFKSDKLGLPINRKYVHDVTRAWEDKK